MKRKLADSRSDKGICRQERSCRHPKAILQMHVAPGTARSRDNLKALVRATRTQNC